MVPLVPSWVRAGDLLDGVLDEHVEEQRPLAALADVDQPLLGGLEFGVGDLVFADHPVHGAENRAGKGVLTRAVSVRTIRAGVQIGPAERCAGGGTGVGGSG